MNSPNYSILANITRDVLIVLVSTIAFEFALSIEGCILDQYRGSLTFDIIEALILMQN